MSVYVCFYTLSYVPTIYHNVINVINKTKQEVGACRD